MISVFARNERNMIFGRWKIITNDTKSLPLQDIINQCDFNSYRDMHWLHRGTSRKVQCFERWEILSGSFMYSAQDEFETCVRMDLNVTGTN
jgi:hypothetical protein